MSDVSINDADLRVFDRLKSEIDAFDLGMADIPAVVERVGDLLDTFSPEVPPTYAEELRSVWWPLLYTLALSRDQERDLTEEEEQAVTDAVAILQRAVQDLGLPGH